MKESGLTLFRLAGVRPEMRILRVTVLRVLVELEPCNQHAVYDATSAALAELRDCEF